MTQGNFILNFFEKICRSNIYLFIISRYLIGKYFSRIIFDNDFNFIRNLEKKRYFNSKKVIIDIGANDGMSYKILRKFSKQTKIISFEPIKKNFDLLKKFENRDNSFRCFNKALSNKNIKKRIYIPFFKKYSITQMAGVDKEGVLKRLKKSLYVKEIEKKIYLKEDLIKTSRLDDYNFEPSLIKIDIEGHEYECILGSIKTIKKHKPIIMVEYDKIICSKIFSVLKRYDYEKFIYNKFSKKIEKFKNQEIFNIFFINKSLRLSLL